MTILVSYVPTPAGYAALDAAIEQAKLRASKIVVLNVGLGTAADVTYADEQHLDAVGEQLTRADVDFEIRQILDAYDVADTVLEVAAELSPELIVLALRRRSRVSAILLGSNAQQIILYAPCPVLSVRAAE